MQNAFTISQKTSLHVSATAFAMEMRMCHMMMVL